MWSGVLVFLSSMQSSAVAEVPISWLCFTVTVDYDYDSLMEILIYK